MNSRLRKALLADDYANKDISKNIQLEIAIKSIYKPLAISQLDGEGTVTTISKDVDTIEYNLGVKKTFTPKKADADVKNALVDPDDLTRYIYVGHVASSINGTVDVIYYDSKFKDMIIIPDTLGFVEHPDSSVDLSNNKFSIAGKAFVSNTKHNTTNEDSDETSCITYSKNIQSNLPVPNDIPGIATHILILNNSFGQPQVNNGGIMLGDRYIEGGFMETIELISLGSTENLFGAGFKHSSYLTSRIAKATYKTKYISNQALDDILLVRL